jgi:2-polyprenyl-6-methoxyphenol hydroxylase-like FAD-dependent oxidoreductase
MATIVVLGGGVIGLSVAMMLKQDGHDVSVFERDREPVPASADEAWRAWERRGVGQFRQPHYLQPAVRVILETHLPEVKAALLHAGAAAFDVLSLMPPSIGDRAPRPGDERFVTITARRPVVEYAVASVAERLVAIRRGITITGLLADAPTNGIPHVTGVRTSTGEPVYADLVIDAMGRGSALPEWLESIVGRAPSEEADDSGFAYYTRYFESTSGAAPKFRAGLLAHFECFSILTLPGDANTWSVSVYISSRDQWMKKKLHEVEHWTALVAACPLHAHLIEGSPITDVVALGGVLDRYRRFVVDGTPIATGVVAIGDSWACTNPSLGRGIAMGLMHAAGTRDVVGRHLGDPLALARAHDEMTEARVTPWYRHTIEIDRARAARIEAAIGGRPVPEPTDPATRVRNALMIATRYDADLFRAFVEMMSLLTCPHEVMARPGLIDTIMEVARGHDAVAPPGPSRAETLRMLA